MCHPKSCFIYFNWYKLVLAAVPGERSPANVDNVIEVTKRRTGGRFMDMITTDECKGYTPAILRHYGVVEHGVPKKVGRRPPKPKMVASEGLNYSVVHKTREKGRVVKTELKIILGDTDKLTRSGNSKAINTAFVERYNGTDRNQNARKSRKTYMFSKDWDTHNLITFFISYCYNFCWPVRTLSPTKSADTPHRITPAMSAKLTDHLWTIREWLTMPVAQLE